MLHRIKRQQRTFLEALVLLGFLLLIAYSVPGFAAHQSPTKAECPQPRFTGQAPDDLYARINPLEANRSNRRAGEELYEDLSDPSCVVCHGKKGDGLGQLSGQFDPPPRNFACAATIDGVPDGQLHIATTWKDDNLWIENYDPATNTCIFLEYSKGNLLQGRVTIKNCNPLLPRATPGP